MKGQTWLPPAAKAPRGGGSVGAPPSPLPPVPAAQAGDGSAKLGGGLKQLVAPPVAARASARSAAAGEGSDVAGVSPVQFDGAQPALVRISLDGTPAAAKTLASLQKMAGVQVVASDLSYGPGLVEAYVPVDQLL